MASVFSLLVALLIVATPAAASLCGAWCVPAAAEHACAQHAPDGTSAVTGGEHDCDHNDAAVVGRSGMAMPDMAPAAHRHDGQQQPAGVRLTNAVPEYPSPPFFILSSITPLRL